MGLGILISDVIAEYIGFTEAFVVAAAMQILGTLLFIGTTARFFSNTNSHKNRIKAQTVKIAIIEGTDTS